MLHANNRKIWRNLRDRFPYPYRAEDAATFLDRVLSDTAPHQFAMDIGGEAIGSIGFEIQDDIFHKSAEIGLWIAEPYWGNGIGTEALTEVSRYAFAGFDIYRLFAHVLSWNESSKRIFLKCGYHREAVMAQAAFKDNVLTDCELYVMLKTSL